jgi:hypothetical protein
VDLLVVLIILMLVFGGGGWYSYRPGGWGPGPGGILWVLAFIVLIVIVVRLLGVG